MPSTRSLARAVGAWDNVHLDATAAASRCYSCPMRTTVSLDEDVAAEVESRRRAGQSLSSAVNELARAGMVSTPARRDYQHHAADLGMRIDVANIGEVLDLLDDVRPEEHTGSRDS